MEFVKIETINASQIRKTLLYSWNANIKTKSEDPHSFVWSGRIRTILWANPYDLWPIIYDLPIRTTLKLNFCLIRTILERIRTILVLSRDEIIESVIRVPLEKRVLLIMKIICLKPEIQYFDRLNILRNQTVHFESFSYYKFDV